MRRGRRTKTRALAMLFCVLLATAAALPPQGRARAAGDATEGYATPNGVRWVEFLPPWDDAEPTATDMSFLLDPPAGKHGRVVVCGEHLCFEDGTRARFWGVNLVAAATVPDKDTADKLAARLAKLGFNAVRFHGLDRDTVLGGLMSRNPATRRYSEANLKKFDYLVAKLAERGIYTYLELQVWPEYLTRDVPDSRFLNESGANQFPAFPWAKYVSLFDPEMIRRQKEWYSVILNHTNPLRNKRYAEDPAVALVEIANENSLFAGWFNGSLDRLPPYYAKQLDDRWNDWLRKRYPNTETLLEKWVPRNDGIKRLSGSANLLLNTNWSLEVHGSARAVVDEHAPGRRDFLSRADMATGRQAMLPAQASLNTEPERNNFWRTVTVERAEKESWQVQYKYPGLTLEAGKWYAVRFKARGTLSQLGIALQENAPPWSGLGLWRHLPLGPHWQEFKVSFLMPVSRNPAKLAFLLGNHVGTVEIRDVALTEETTMPSLTNGEAMVRPRYSSDEPYPNTGLEQYVAFLTDLERAYFAEMRDEIRRLGYAGPIVGTNSYGWAGAMVQAETMDVLDQHAYWDHPNWPRAFWSKSDWVIGNKSMLNSPQNATLVDLAYSRVRGKPFIVSEYNHAFPNQFDIEGLPIIAAYGAIQDWDGIFIYNYSHGALERRALDRFFDIDRHPGKLAILPIAAVLFMRDIPPASSSMTVGVDELAAARVLISSGVNMGQNVRQKGFDLLAPLRHRVGLSLKGATLVQAANQDSQRTTLFTNGNAEPKVVWRNEPQGGRLEIRSANSLALLGFIADKDLTTETLAISMPKRKTGALSEHIFGMVGLTTLDGKPASRSNSFLALAVGRTQNQGMRLTLPGETIPWDWGNGQPRLEVIPATLHVKRAARQVRAFALDARGRRVAEIPVVHSGREGWTVPLGRNGTPWHEIVVE